MGDYIGYMMAYFFKYAQRIFVILCMNLFKEVAETSDKKVIRGCKNDEKNLKKFVVLKIILKKLEKLEKISCNILSV